MCQMGGVAASEFYERKDRSKANDPSPEPEGCRIIVLSKEDIDAIRESVIRNNQIPLLRV